MDFLVKIKTSMQWYLTNYQYLCTHETVYEKTLSTNLVEQRYNYIMGMHLLAVHPLRHHLVPTDHLLLFLHFGGICQLSIDVAPIHPPLHAHRQEVGAVSRALHSRRIAHQQSDVQPHLQLGDTAGELSPGW